MKKSHKITQLLLFTLFCSIWTNYIYGQNNRKDSIDNVEIIYDIDSIPYKKIVMYKNRTDTIYIDLQNKIRKIFYSVDIMPKPKDIYVNLYLIIGQEVKLPNSYPTNNKYIGVLSMIIEVNGSITNLRIIEGFERSKSAEILSGLQKKLPVMTPALKNGKVVPVEMKIEFGLISLGK